jgi:hypothetical protein
LPQSHFSEETIVTENNLFSLTVKNAKVAAMFIEGVINKELQLKESLEAP